MELHKELRCGTLIVSVQADRIDAAVALQFKDAMRQATDHGLDRIVLDLQRVDFVDSSGLGAIVGSMKQLPDGKSLELVALTPTVSKVFQLTRLDTIFAIHKTLSDAFAEEEV
ncbi:MAG: STAS domain-containing protein [Cognatishimia sp.]|uniref:STAS domain-containing protein n=1 Tax=Cognatishimia sp. TaxID=2211648 RepID=UPI003B8D7D0A